MGSPLRLLVVEDSDNDYALVVREIGKCGYDVSAERVETAEAMTAALDRGGFDLVVSDFQMPAFSGPAALALLRERDLEIPFIIVSGTIGEEVAVESLKAGANDFLTKQRLARLGPAIERELREARDRRARRAAELQRDELEERYRLLVEQIPAVLYVAAADRIGQLLYVSPQIEAMLGFPTSEWTDPELWGRQTHPDDVKGADEAFARLRTTGAAERAEYRMFTKEGRQLWVRDEARLVPWADRGELVVQGILQDITGLKQAQEEMGRQRETMHQTEKIAALGQLLAGVAHELNNPLSILLGQAMLLRRKLAGQPEDARAEKIEVAAERCARIVRNFLALARQQPASRSAVSVLGVVEGTLELVAYPLRTDGIEVAVDVERELPLLWADPHQLQQVLINLVTNAQHVLRGIPPPRRITITARFDAPLRRAVIEVRDNGPGIPAEITGRIFEPFFTTKPLGEGTGLGLSLCRGVVESHGGSMALVSGPGEGASFRIELPVQAAQAPSGAGSRPADAPAPRASHILVVDDEPGVADLVAEVLRGDGHTVAVVNSGLAALEYVMRDQFDLVVTDVRMPGLDGPGFYRAAEAGQPGVGRRFIFLTGDTLAPGTREFLEETRRPHLAKPFEIEDLQRIVAEALAPRT